jgi:sec-independent protein translocase protein TatC
MANPEPTEAGQGFISHLLELRDRLLRMILGILALFLLLFPFANDIYHFVAAPLLAILPKGTQMIATQVASPFLTPFKLSMVTAVFLAMPWILYQFWSFVAPGLYQHEKRLALPLMASSVILFYLGMAFSYFFVFPLIFGFMVSVTPEGVAMMTDISSYLDFVLTLFFAFGVAFEVPIATVLLVISGITTPESLIEKRPYIIVAAFVVGMLLTPPDVFSQTLLAVPMWLLFEAGVFFSRYITTNKPQDTDAKPAPANPSPHQTPQPDPIIPPSTPDDPPRYIPMTEEEMENELNAIIAAEEKSDSEDDPTPAPATLDDNLKQANELRLQGDLILARDLLYEVLRHGDEKQVEVARNILRQLDSD